MNRRRISLLALLGLLILSAGCGQMGPLTLPEDQSAADGDESDEENER